MTTFCPSTNVFDYWVYTCCIAIHMYTIHYCLKQYVLHVTNLKSVVFCFCYYEYNTIYLCSSYPYKHIYRDLMFMKWLYAMLLVEYMFSWQYRPCCCYVLYLMAIPFTHLCFFN